MESRVIDQKAIVTSLEEEYINDFDGSSFHSMEDAQDLFELQQERDRAV